MTEEAKEIEEVISTAVTEILRIIGRPPSTVADLEPEAATPIEPAAELTAEEQAGDLDERAARLRAGVS